MPLTDTPTGAAPAQQSTTPAAQPAQGKTAKPMRFEDLDGMSLDELSGATPRKEQAKPNEADEEASEDIDDEDDDAGLEDDEDADETDVEGDSEEEVEETDDEDELDDDETEDEEDEADDVGDEDKKVHKVKVNGELKTYSLRDLKNIASSALHTLKNRQDFESHIANERAVLGRAKGELTLASQKLGPAFELLKGKKIEDAVFHLAEEAGISSLEMKREYRKAMLPQIAQWLGLSQEQYQAAMTRMAPNHKVWEIQEENEYLKEQSSKAAKAAEARSKQTQANSGVQEQLNKFIATHDVTKKEMRGAYEWLVQVDGSEEKITPDRIQETVLTRRACDTAVEAILASRPRLVKDQAFVDRAAALCLKHPGKSVSEVAKWVHKQARKMKEKQSQGAEQSAIKDLSRKALRGGGKSSLQNPRSGAQRKPMSFRDLDPEGLP